MNEIETKIWYKLRDELGDKFSIEKIEELYGIVVTKNPKEENSTTTYNIHDKETGKVLLPNIYLWDVQGLFSAIGNGFANDLCESAKEEEQKEDVDILSNEIEEQQKDYEEKYYRTCGICGFRYDTRTTGHYHT